MTTADPEETPTGRPCPICAEPGRVRWRPFCSKRCADIDLGGWLTERYATPQVEADDGALPEARDPKTDG